jgi:oxygen-dependent protoporphyrinogen oxidase
MHVIVVGAGAAGLAAAWRLVEAGADVTLLEQADHAGGRCHSVYWHDGWRITGAAAFTSVEENLIDQAQKLGLYRDAELMDLSGQHTHDVLLRRSSIISLRDFEPTTVLGCAAIPLAEKLAMLRMVPKYLRQRLHADWRDPTPAASFDDQTAAAYLRSGAPTFVDYVLEPIMQHFNGFSDDDLSLGWLLWILAGRPWSRQWWSFHERGVGRLTHAMAEELERRGVQLHLNASAEAIRFRTAPAEVDVLLDGIERTLTADAVVCAVPGSLVNELVVDLDRAHREFFAAVRYGALHLAYYLVDLPEAELPEALILPTADGFQNTAYYSVEPLGNGSAVVHAEMKGAASAAARHSTDQEVQELLWADIESATGAMGDCVIRDFLLSRNDIAIVKPYVGYLSALRAFRQAAPLPRLAFAGDYLITSTVGQAHYTGLKAAERLLAMQHQH